MGEDGEIAIRAATIIPKITLQPLMSDRQKYKISTRPTAK